MGFFKDFKRDFAQAVNELMPDPNELGAEYDDEDMVNTFDEGDLMEVAPEDLLENLDDIKIDGGDFDLSTVEDITITKPSDSEKTAETTESVNIYENVPNAEIIVDQNEINMNTFDDMEEIEAVPELLQGEKIQKKEANVKSQEPESDRLPEGVEDELVAIDSLDEENMLENTAEAFSLEPDVPYSRDDKTSDMDIQQAVENALAKSGEEAVVELSDNVPTDMKEVEDSTKQSELFDKNETKSEKKTTKEEIFSSDITYITKSTSIKGDVTSDGDVDVIGTVVGNVKCEGKLVVGGTITGNVTAGEMYANAAKIEGETRITDSVKIGVGSIIVGNVYAGSAVIAGAIKGDIDVQGPVIVDSTAVIMGNIKSRSVQINNGAVIEGMCSQCYSEIDVKSFFE